jgi:hypothetical protein
MSNRAPSKPAGANLCEKEYHKHIHSRRTQRCWLLLVIFAICEELWWGPNKTGL